MSNEAIMRQKDIRPPPCEIDYKGMRFLITDRPNDQTIHNYIAVSFNSKQYILIKNIICIFN